MIIMNANQMTYAAQIHFIQCIVGFRSHTIHFTDNSIFNDASYSQY